MLRIVIAIVLVAHGIGHVLGPLQALKISQVNPAWDGDSWLLTRIVGPTITQTAGLALWAIALVGFIAAAAIAMGWLPIAWWAPVALGSAVVSLLAIALFPAAFPAFSTVAAAIVDILLIVAIVVARWTPEPSGI